MGHLTQGIGLVVVGGGLLLGSPPAEALRPPATASSVASDLEAEVMLTHLETVADSLLELGILDAGEMAQGLRWLAASVQQDTPDGPWAKLTAWLGSQGVRPRTKQGVTLAFWLDVWRVTMGQPIRRSWMTEQQLRAWQRQVRDVRGSL